MLSCEGKVNSCNQNVERIFGNRIFFFSTNQPFVHMKAVTDWLIETASVCNRFPD